MNLVTSVKVIENPYFCPFFKLWAVSSRSPWFQGITHHRGLRQISLKRLQYCRETNSLSDGYLGTNQKHFFMLIILLTRSYEIRVLAIFMAALGAKSQ